MLKTILSRRAAAKRKRAFPDCLITTTTPKPYPEGKDINILPFTNERSRLNGRKKSAEKINFAN